MVNSNNWGRRANDAGKEKGGNAMQAGSRHINAKPKRSESSLCTRNGGSSVETMFITRMQTMFFKVVQLEKTICIETTHIYGATGFIHLAPLDLRRYLVLMKELEVPIERSLPIDIDNWCTLERDAVHHGLVIRMNSGQESTGAISFGPREMETLQIRALIKTMSAVQMVAQEMQILPERTVQCG